jgi:hypothetical protein
MQEPAMKNDKPIELKPGAEASIAIDKNKPGEGKLEFVVKVAKDEEKKPARKSGLQAFRNV